MTLQLTVSLVVYDLDDSVLQDTLVSLREAISAARQAGEVGAVEVTLVDNGDQAAALEALVSRCFPGQPGEADEGLRIDVISGHGNIGFGQAHNLVIHHIDPDSDPDSHYHLILNPDVVMQADALRAGLRYLAQHPDCAAVSPGIEDGSGTWESGCKRYPSMLDFLLRGFAPAAVKRMFHKRLAHYEMRDLPADRVSTNVPIISGCFMLFRQSILRQVSGFDPRYFLYFEDFDLSLRAGKLGRLCYLPQMKITHLGGNSARKGLRHIAMFARSAIRFFSTHGWRWL